MKVRDVIKQVEVDGWFQTAQRGSHRQFKHAVKAAKVTVAGHQSAEMAKGTYNNIPRQARLK